MKIQDFFDTDFNDFATYDTFRSVASYIDGLKPSARKVIYTVDEYNIKTGLKVAQLVSKTSEKTEFLHGEQSLVGVVVGLAQDFAGANNINVLKPEGSFGNRTIPKAAASRYIFTSKEKAFDKIFNEKDKPILIEQEFEGSKIEPRFYVPTIPLLLVNGNEGIGNGFAQKILPRNPKTIIKHIKKVISTKEKLKTRIEPYFKNFTGDIKWNKEEENWYIYGKFERVKRASILVTELPIGYDLEKYIDILNKLEENKEIVTYTDKSEDNKFCFEIRTTEDFVKQDDEVILKRLKLISKISENFTCIDENNSIRVFDNEVSIFNAYCDKRLEYYTLRKEYQLAKLKSELEILKNKYKFIYHITKDEIVVNKKSKEDIENQCNKRGLMKIGDSYNYLINMAIYSLSIEKMKELKEQIEKLNEDINNLVKKTNHDLWLIDIDTLERLL